MKTYHVPSPATDYVALARSRSGRLFKKQILKFGNFAHPNLPGEQLVITPEVGQHLIDNFRRKVCDIVQFPIVGDDNAHTEDPLRNAGEIVDLSTDDVGVWATIDVRDDKVAPRVGTTILGASAMLHMDYTDTRTGQKVGPTLLHVAATNRPYITDLANFEEMVSMSADGEANEVLALTEVGTQMMTLDEIKTALLDHGIDLDALMAQAGEQAPTEGATPPNALPAAGPPRETIAAMSNVLEAAGVALSNSDSPEGPSVRDIGEGIISLAAANEDLTVRLSATETERDEAVTERDGLKAERTESEIDGLIKEARILPFQRESMIALANNDRATFDAIVPKTALVSLSEEGVTSHSEPESVADRNEEVDRYVHIADEQ